MFFIPTISKYASHLVIQQNISSHRHYIMPKYFKEIILNVINVILDENKKKLIFKSAVLSKLQSLASLGINLNFIYL